MHCDKHVVKMILESAQLLSTAHRVLDGTETVEKRCVIGSTPARWRNVKKWKLNDARETSIYSASHVNHPSAVWVRSNIDHYRYLHDLFIFLIDEYKFRYGNKSHKCEQLVVPLFSCPINIQYEASWEEPPQAMPDDCKVLGDSVEAYRNYYKKYKYSMSKWTRREIPSWFVL